MGTFVKFALVAACAFLAGVIWQADFFQKSKTTPPEVSHLSPAPAEEIPALPTTPDPTFGTAEARAIEHYRAVIRLGVAERLAQQRIRDEALRQQATLALAAEKERQQSQLEEDRRLAEQQKVQNQLILATAKAQEAQAHLDHERAQQAALETQWLIKEEQRRREELAFQRTQDEHLKTENKRQQLLNLHAEHQLISTLQARKARAAQRSRRHEAESDREQPHERTRSNQENSNRPQRSTPHSTTRENSSPQRSSPQTGQQQQKAAREYRENFQKQAEKQQERIRNAFKK